MKAGKKDMKEIVSSDLFTLDFCKTCYEDFVELRNVPRILFFLIQLFLIFFRLWIFDFSLSFLYEKSAWVSPEPIFIQLFRFIFVSIKPESFVPICHTPNTPLNKYISNKFI